MWEFDWVELWFSGDSRGSHSVKDEGRTFEIAWLGDCIMSSIDEGVRENLASLTEARNSLIEVWSFFSVVAVDQGGVRFL